ncbi:hypothetical protein CAOG_08044 [Capsaspora owczarzaki ATCC 30864]|uniref:BZIP domain-containing protein n=1 Tax=Capsaspora owczarzaki (strain ATCC 30864) TaxID=595528 RepID=A0A0D2WXM1_CAPO3|nr:hypothetical protein CAOG_08044 [Capsaspora owczarzaki ATCC 30864]KJE97985.1 hypothetical protein CAOG_008044 [Capsaspora owczarzaki ATCC 30864]|eukprot:XP_004342645.1 hypothetical protein CAOG_08044 [Capsaspora owczarzaki ATCC 30864]
MLSFATAANPSSHVAGATQAAHAAASVAAHPSMHGLAPVVAPVPDLDAQDHSDFQLLLATPDIMGASVHSHLADAANPLPACFVDLTAEPVLKKGRPMASPLASSFDAVAAAHTADQHQQQQQQMADLQYLEHAFDSLDAMLQHEVIPPVVAALPASPSSSSFASSPRLSARRSFAEIEESSTNMSSTSMLSSQTFDLSLYEKQAALVKGPAPGSVAAVAAAAAAAAIAAGASPTTPARKPRVAVAPATQRTEKYLERRRKNNEAAKRCRDAKKLKEDMTGLMADALSEENQQLRARVAFLEDEIEELKRMVLSRAVSTPSTA